MRAAQTHHSKTTPWFLVRTTGRGLQFPKMEKAGNPSAFCPPGGQKQKRPSWLVPPLDRTSVPPKTQNHQQWEAVGSFAKNKWLGRTLSFPTKPEMPLLSSDTGTAGAGARGTPPPKQMAQPGGPIHLKGSEEFGGPHPSDAWPGSPETSSPIQRHMGAWSAEIPSSPQVDPRGTKGDPNRSRQAKEPKIIPKDSGN